MDITGKDVISWVPTGKSVSLEEVMNVLELNAENAKACFAVIKDPSTQKGYVGLILDKSEVIFQ